MTSSEQQERQFQRIDEAISRDIKRRQKNKTVYWILLAWVVIIAVYAILQGRTDSEVVAVELSSDTEFTSDVADEVTNSPSVIEKIASSQQVRDVVEEEALKLSQNSQFASQLLSSPTLTDWIESSVEKVAAGMTGDLIRDVNANRAAIAEFQNRIQNGTGSTGSNDRSDELTRFLTEQKATELRLRQQIESLTRDVATLQREQTNSQSTIRKLEGLAASSERPRNAGSYLLKESSRTALSDIGLLVTLGRKSGGAIDNVVFSDSQGVIDTATADSVRIGQSFVITDRSGRQFEATLTYDQARFFAKDYVGLEMVPVP